MASSSKRRKLNLSTPEIVFDDSARADFLTGFHKRKQARIRHAQEVAAIKERRDKLRDRAVLRRRRKEQLEEHVAAINNALREAIEPGDGEDIQEFEEWQGIEDDQDVDREDEYIDEDKFTTVTVESVGISRDGFTRPNNVDRVESPEEGEEAVEMNGRRDSSTLEKPAKKRSNSKSKKRSFRYESKEERSIARFKEKQKSRARRNTRNQRR